MSLEALRHGYEHFNENGRLPSEIFESPIDLGAFEDVRLQPTELVYECRDQIAVRVWITARGRGGGEGVKRHVFHVWTMRNGKAVHWRSFSSRRDAMDAALDESAAPAL
jgi:hypothetical protein